MTSIGNGAFQNCSGLTSVDIPNSVTSIGKWAFQYCRGLTSVTIPNSVTSIGISAFNDCSGLTSVYIDCTTIGYWFRDNRRIKEVSIGENVTSIEDDAFNGCSGLTSVTIPKSVTSIGNGAFDGCSGLTSVTIGNSVKSIGYSAFEGCSGLTSVTIPKSVTSIGEKAFKDNYLTSIIVESGNTVYDSRDSCNAIIETASNTLIAGCNNSIIPNSVITIGDYAFYGCGNLASVTIPNSVTSIGNRAFYGCRFQEGVKVDIERPLSIDFYTFYNCTNATLYVPKGSKAAYQAANYWKEFKAIVEFPDADVNQDGEIDVVDVVDIARFVVGIPGDTFVEFLADLNSDDEVNVADAVVLVNEIAGDQNFAKAFGVHQSLSVGDDCLTLTENDNHSLSFSMESLRPYTAFQYDLYTNSEADVMNLCLNDVRKNGHQLIYNKVEEGHYRVAVLSTANNVFNGNNGELLHIQLDGFDSADVTITNIHFITADGTVLRFDDLSLSSATRIESFTPTPSPKEEGNVYDLSGRKVSVPSVLPKGVYIVNGKKVMVK